MSKINESSFYSELGRRLKERRLALSLRQDQVAAGLGIERTSLAHIEAARQKPALHVFLLLCRELHVAPEAMWPDLREFEEPEIAESSPGLDEEIQIVGAKLTPALSAFLRTAQSERAREHEEVVE